MDFHSDSSRAFVTGLDGFTGRYLASALKAKGWQVSGSVHGHESAVKGSYNLDLCDFNRVKQVVKEVQPDVVAHLAAVSFVAHDDIDLIYRVNLLGTRNLLRALSELDKKPRVVLIASSANVYGNTSVDLISESEPFLPVNDYAVSKVAMEYMARLWMEKLPLVITRPFNYTGVGQASHFLLSKIVDHFVRGDKVIELGNLDVARDFSDVRFVASVYEHLLAKPVIGQTINVCSGNVWSLEQVLEIMAEIAGYEIQVRVNPAFVRTSEVKCLRGDNTYLKALKLDCSPIPLIDTLRWMYKAGLEQE